MSAVFWHVGLTISDLARSANFYREIVGMDEGEHMPSANVQFATLVDNPGVTLNSVFLTQGRFTLQLLQYLTKGGTKLPLAHNNIGSPHMAFFVPDIQAKRAALVARGDVTITSPIVTNERATLRSFYVTDPDGVPIEFVEKLS